MSPFLNGGDERQIKGMTAQAIEEFNDAAYQAWAGDLEPCPNCGRRFLPDRLAVHARACSKAPKSERPASSGAGGTGGGIPSSRGVTKPKHMLPVCHLCGREFGTASLAIHQKSCAEKYEREKGKPAPEAPSIGGGASDGDERALKPTAKDWEVR